MTKGNSTRMGVLMVFLSFLVFIGLMTDARAEVKENGPVAKEKEGIGVPPTARPSLEERMAEYKLKAKEKLAELDKNIGELEAEAKKKGTEIRQDARKGIKELEKKKAVVQKDLKRLEAAGKKTWEKAQKKVDAGLEELQKAYERVKGYFRSGE